MRAGHIALRQTWRHTSLETNPPAPGCEARERRYPGYLATSNHLAQGQPESCRAGIRPAAGSHREISTSPHTRNRSSVFPFPTSLPSICIKFYTKIECSTAAVYATARFSKWG
ncbi:hypothetical protein G6F65_015748 [Rhizopus arrhizus]|nr:hypothetical protein G6F65_015748 [Rhizopus arrhizus]